jgi:hypothetical protein
LRHILPSTGSSITLPNGQISKTAMTRALGMATYLETHARRAYGAGPEPETAAAKSILTHIRKGDLADGFSARDVYRRGWSNLCDKEQAQVGLDLLSDLDWIGPVDKRSEAGGRPTTRYRINPRACR